MAPSPEERISALENEKEHDKEFQREMKETLKRLPGRIARRTQKQIVACQQRKDPRCGEQKDSKIASSIFDSIDPKNIVKLFIICVVIGGLISGFVCQSKNPDVPISSLLQQEGFSKPK